MSLNVYGRSIASIDTEVQETNMPGNDDVVVVVVDPRDINIPEDTRSVQSQHSMIVSSSGGSVRYPYPTLLKDTSFPRCHLMARPDSRAETFIGSLSMLGHGTPLWDPVGGLGGCRDPGISIGDVGFINDGGDFEPFFNIFLPPNHPRQESCPPNLVPLDVPLESEIVRNPIQFPPGMALVSNGIEASVLSSSPLDIKFTFNAREGGILVLPDGASREDLVSTTRIRSYVQKHALEWYLLAKRVACDAVVNPNGTLYVVTGTDKATTWASCTTFTRKTRFHRLWKPSIITYQGNTEEYGHFWKTDMITEDELIYKRSRKIAGVTKYALFIRGMRIAVSVRDWSEHLLRYKAPDVNTFSVIRTTPGFGLVAKMQTLLECLPGYMQRCPSEEGSGYRVIFHPLDVILRLLLKESPSSTMAYIEDHIWCSVADKSDASLASIMRLLVQILETHETFMEDGRITLVPRGTNQLDQVPTTLHSLLLRFSTYMKRREILNRLAKVFPGPKVPRELFKWQ